MGLRMNARSIHGICFQAGNRSGNRVQAFDRTGAGNRPAYMGSEQVGTGVGNRWETNPPGKGAQGGVTVRNPPGSASVQNRTQRAPGSLARGSHG